MDADPFFIEVGGDLDAARAAGRVHRPGAVVPPAGQRAPAAGAPLPSYDPEAAALVAQRVPRLLADVAPTTSESAS